MSTLLMDERILAANYPLNNSCRSRILKSRENIGKLKCNKSLKNKLKKYKLRKDGQEDPDILDVSQSLIKSLRIKSPNNQKFNSHNTCEENIPHNYLTKMVRLKKNVAGIDSKQADISQCNGECVEDPISLTPNSDHDKKQTDAFKLLMDSRNKSIGTNSPGKVKCEEDSVGQDSLDKKELRAKRILSLNRMAQAKGSSKKLELEEYREEQIKRKMKDRARKFKRMIVDVGEKTKKRDSANVSIAETVKVSSDPNTSHPIKNGDSLHKPILKSFDIFKQAQENINSEIKKISKEDQEFLKKLSPSIRKKENMLCYFQKVSKETDLSQDVCDTDISQDVGDTGSTQNNQLIYKVKLKSGIKTKRKKKKHNTGKDTKMLKIHQHDSGAMNENLNSNISKTSDNGKKRKRNENNDEEKKEITNLDVNGSMKSQNDCRPKRNTKKPVKYADDFQLSSSDEELHIFTPKKKRQDRLESQSTMKATVDDTKDHIKIGHCNTTDKVVQSKKGKKAKDIKKKFSNNEDHKDATSIKVTKLAPIFVSKPSIDTAAIEAKQKFLQSGVPSQLKKVSTHQNNILASDEFQKVVHIQQLNDIATSKTSTINLITTEFIEDINLKENKNFSYKKLLQVPTLENYSIPKLKDNVDHILQFIKETYPKFPVYRTYHLLKGKSKGEFKDCIYPDLDNSIEIFNNILDIHNVQPDKLNWVDKYKPTTEKQVIGNFESIRELKRWLVSWTENDAKSKKNKSESDLSDFYQSDTDSREAMKNENNLLIITGKVGTGKTLSVYAVAAELAIKVIEVNASTKRTGKIMLQDLQEATQSHKVDRGKNTTESAQKQEICKTNDLLIVPKKRGRKKKVKVDSMTKAFPITTKESTELTVIQENIRTGMSLILIDDADIVFEQDDGFCYAISQLIQSSKRPVILVTSSLSCPHLQRFSSLAKIIKMRPFLPRMLGTWLDIMCLVDNNTCSPGFGAKVLDLFRGDIRRTINYLQFYMASHKRLTNTEHAVLQDEESLKMNADDENSCMSWGDSEGWGDKNIGLSNCNDVGKSVMDKELHFMSPSNNFHCWWNLPNLFNYSEKISDHKLKKNSKRDKITEIKELNSIASVLDDMSISDYLGIMNEEPNITSGPWQTFEKDSVVDNENFATYSRNRDCINEISWELMIRSIAKAQEDIGSGNKTEINYPSMSIQRERDQVVSRHKTLTSCLNPSTILDRRALALDYWSSCRSICRAEKNKTNSGSKRNNRFCHYLKSLNIVCRNEYFDNLGESLCIKK